MVLGSRVRAAAVKLSEFKPVLVCTSCEAVILVWEEGFVDTGEKPTPRKVSWRSKNWFFEDSVKTPNVSGIAASWACCPSCGVTPLALRQTAARHTEAVWYEPMAWLFSRFERRWFLAEHLKLKSKAGSVSLAADEQEPQP